MMMVLIHEVYLKATNIDDWGKISVEMEAGGEFSAVMETENISRASERIRTQKQKLTCKLFSQPVLQRGLLNVT